MTSSIFKYTVNPRYLFPQITSSLHLTIVHRQEMTVTKGVATLVLNFSKGNYEDLCYFLNNFDLTPCSMSDDI